jgi:hypothetical protein
MEYFYSNYTGKSEKYAQKYGLYMRANTKGHNDEVDAFRHAFAQALLCLKLSENTARRLGTVYEMYDDIADRQPRKERNMDQWNNAVGREIAREIKITIEGKNYKPQEIEDIVAEKIIKRMKKGDLITNPETDTRKYNEKTFKERMLNLKNRVFYKNELTMNDIDNNPELMDEFLNQALEQKELPTKETLDNQVAIGNMIYVKNYERSDGTKVSGYYRSC